MTYIIIEEDELQVVDMATYNAQFWTQFIINGKVWGGHLPREKTLECTTAIKSLFRIKDGEKVEVAECS